MKIPELKKFLRHGKESQKRQDIIIVVVADGLFMHIHREGPEAIDGHLFTEAQGCVTERVPWTGAGREFPYFSRTSQCYAESWGWQRALFDWHQHLTVCNKPGGMALSRLIEKAGMDVTVVIDLHVVHKRLSGPQQVPNLSKRRVTLNPGKSNSSIPLVRFF